jgi:S1-C subfamily serine protease
MMLKKIFAYGAALIVGGFLSASAFAVDPVVNPVVNNDGCTAFYIGNEMFLTAGHCAVGGGAKVTLNTADNRKIDAEYLAMADPFNGWQDWAILRAKSPYLTRHMKPFELNCQYNPKTGDKITVIGYPGGLGLMTVEGKIASDGMSPYEVWKYPVMRLNISITYGNSGSPILTEDGKAVGIAVGIEPKAPTLSIGQPLEFMCKVFNYAP